MHYDDTIELNFYRASLYQLCTAAWTQTVQQMLASAGFKSAKGFVVMSGNSR